MSSDLECGDMSPLSDGATRRADQSAVVPAQSKRQSGERQSGERQSGVVPPHSKTIPGRTKVSVAGKLRKKP